MAAARPTLPPRAVLWDVDGTLSDSARLGISATNVVLARRGLPAVDEAAYHAGTRFTTARRLAWHVYGSPDDVAAEALGREFDQLYVAQVSRATAPLFAGVDDTLRQLAAEHGCVFGAVSNACTAYAEAVLASNDIAALFPVALGADAVTAAKPAPDGLLECARRLGVDPARCVYVGDSPTDGLAAAAAGMRSVCVTWGSFAADALAPRFESLAHTPAELLAALRLALAAMCDA